MAENRDLNLLRAMAPAHRMVVVSPHATNNLPDGIADALWINDDGVVTVAVVGRLGTVVTMTVRGPGLLPVNVKAVRVTGTSATSIMALY